MRSGGRQDREGEGRKKKEGGGRGEKVGEEEGQTREAKQGRRNLPEVHSHANSGNCLLHQQPGGSFRVLVCISLIPHQATPRSPLERLISFHENNFHFYNSRFQ